jgi:CBS domain-containing protein
MDNSLVVPARAQSATSLLGRTGLSEDTVLEPDDSAFCALTDFRFDYPITVGPDSSTDDALAEMNRFGVHALLVIRDDVDDMEHLVVGLITHYDIERSNPHRYPGSATRPHNGRRVSDVMTPWNELSLVHYDSLTDLTAADLFERFQGTGLTHLLVIEMRIDESALARGLISRGALAKRLSRYRSTAGH